MSVTVPACVLAEFETAEALVEATRKVREAGYTRMEAYAPYPLPEAAQALGCQRSGVAFLVLVGGIAGGLAGFFMQWWISTQAYRLNIGGRPPNSWPMFIPITFELTVLTAALAAFLSVFVLCRLPRFHHPLFAAPLFARATDDGFYLCISVDDLKFDPFETWSLLQSLHALGIQEVGE
jgi:hypothetical protein